MKRRRLSAAISLALVVALLPPPFCWLCQAAVSMPASAVTQAEIDALKENAGELEQQQKEIQAQLNAIAGRQGRGTGTEEPAGAADQRDPVGDQQHRRTDRQI